MKTRAPLRLRPQLLPTRRLFLGNGLVTLAALVAPGLGCGSSDDSPKGSGGSGGTGGGADGGAGTGGVGGSGGAGGAGGVPQLPDLESLIGDIGPLGNPDANGVRLPSGFTARIVATAGEKPVATSDYVWHGAPDGGATYPTADGGWIYVSNSELPLTGGAAALVFDKDGALVESYSILQNTNVNCAGGRTPWGTWLSCEEVAKGRVFECDPYGKEAAVELPALGIFKHEAAAVDLASGHVYLTEDEGDGRFYRFTPSSTASGGRLDLSAGKLEVAEVATDGGVTWHELPDPQFTGATPTRAQVPASTAFRGGEGIWFFDGVVYFSTKGDDRIWSYDVAANSLEVLYDADTSATPILTGVDNVTVSCCGDVLVAEDGGDMEIIAILPDGSLKPLVQITGHVNSEITGPAFDPSGTRLYFSSQRGPNGVFTSGVTYEVTGPFHRPA